MPALEVTAGGGRETRVTTEFAEVRAGTRMTMTILFATRQARDAALATDIAEGMGQSYDRLVRFLARG